MKFIINFLKWIFIAFILIFTHYAISYLLPWPLNNINIIFLAIIILIIGWESGASIWLSCLLHFFIELYSISPFGLILLPSAIGIVFAYWLYIFIFTNRSWTSALALVAIAIIVYRILYTLAFIMVENFNKGFNFDWRALLVPYFWELSLTSIMTGFAIFIFSKIWKRFSVDKAII